MTNHDPEAATQIRERDRRRWLFLRYLYDDAQRVGANQRQSVPSEEVGAALGIAADERSRVEDYLKDKRLIEFTSFGPHLGITHYGIDYVERAIREPDRPSPYLAPVTYILNVQGGIHGSQVQQGTHGSTQQQIQRAPDWDGIRALLPELRALAGSTSDEDRAAATADVATLEAQLGSTSATFFVIRLRTADCRRSHFAAAGFKLLICNERWTLSVGVASA
jgi:hypothetical protein